MYYEADDATVLFDPLVPAGEEDDFFRHLDADIERRGLPVVVLLTADWHRRSAGELAARYEGRIGGVPPEGVEEIPIEGADERQVAYFLSRYAALIVAEIFWVDVRGELAWDRVLSSNARTSSRRRSTASMQLPVERLLVSHGEPILEGATARMADALARG